MKKDAGGRWTENRRRETYIKQNGKEKRVQITKKANLIAFLSFSKYARVKKNTMLSAFSAITNPPRRSVTQKLSYVLFIP